MPRQVSDHRSAAQRICDLSPDGELHVVSPMYPAQPDELLSALIAEAQARDLVLRLYVADLSGRYEFLTDPLPGPEQLRIVTIGGRVPRRLSRRVDFLPMTLYEVARTFEAGLLRVDAFVAQVGHPDKEGRCPLGPVVSYSPSAIAAARVLVLELNCAFMEMPGQSGPRIDEAHVIVSAGTAVLRELAPRAPTPAQQRIGELLAGLIPNGATLQLGIGGIPEGFLGALHDHVGLRIHSGAIPEAAIELIDAGVVSSEREHVTTSLLGTARLYAYAADPRNRFRIKPVTVTHAPATLAALTNFHSVNSAFEVDLTGQVNAEYAGGEKRASAGGQSDFGRWAHLSSRGNIIAMTATNPDGGSTIVPALSAPYAVTTHRSDLDYVVTEYGVADLRGQTLAGREAALVAVADPAHRSELVRSLA